MKRIKLKWKNIILFLVIIILITQLIISGYNIIRWKLDSNKTKDQIDSISNIINVAEVIENDETQIEIVEQEEEIPQFNPYWDYIKMNLINVDFNELKNINNNTIGWIQVNGTNVNYPFVQSNDNKYYLTHSFDNSYNTAGWVFLDYRNDINSIKKNTIIYAHGMKDNTMFGSLKNILNNGWLNDVNNYIVKLSTEKYNTLWQVFSVYRIPTTSDYIKVDFNSNNEFKEWALMLLNRSAYYFNTTINDNDNILTLSTCYNDDDKLVLHAKLIKREIKY